MTSKIRTRFFDGDQLLLFLRGRPSLEDIQVVPCQGVGWAALGHLLEFMEGLVPLPFPE